MSRALKISAWSATALLAAWVAAVGATLAAAGKWLEEATPGR